MSMSRPVAQLVTDICNVCAFIIKNNDDGDNDANIKNEPIYI